MLLRFFFIFFLNKHYRIPLTAITTVTLTSLWWGTFYSQNRSVASTIIFPVFVPIPEAWPVFYFVKAHLQAFLCYLEVPIFYQPWLALLYSMSIYWFMRGNRTGEMSDLGTIVKPFLLPFQRTVKIF